MNNEVCINGANGQTGWVHKKLMFVGRKYTWTGDGARSTNGVMMVGVTGTRAHAAVGARLGRLGSFSIER